MSNVFKRSKTAHRLAELALMVIASMFLGAPGATARDAPAKAYEAVVGMPASSCAAAPSRACGEPAAFGTDDDHGGSSTGGPSGGLD